MFYQFDTAISSVIPTTRTPRGTRGQPPPQPRAPAPGPLSPELLERMQRYWEAANYLTIGQIYLQANPLLREPLRRSTSSRGCSAIGAPRRG